MAPVINNNRDIREYNRIVPANANDPARQTANTTDSFRKYIGPARQLQIQ